MLTIRRLEVEPAGVIQLLRLKQLDFDAGQPVRKLTVVDRFDHLGDVTSRFETAEMFSSIPPMR